MIIAKPSCRRLLIHFVPWAFDLALLNAGRSMAARIAMMAMTTRSSIKVKPGSRKRESGVACREFALIGVMDMSSQFLPRLTTINVRVVAEFWVGRGY